MSALELLQEYSAWLVAGGDVRVGVLRSSGGKVGPEIFLRELYGEDVKDPMPQSVNPSGAARMRAVIERHYGGRE